MYSDRVQFLTISDDVEQCWTALFQAPNLAIATFNVVLPWSYFHTSISNNWNDLLLATHTQTVFHSERSQSVLQYYLLRSISADVFKQETLNSNAVKTIKCHHRSPNGDKSSVGFKILINIRDLWKAFSHRYCSTLILHVLHWLTFVLTARSNSASLSHRCM